MGKAEGNGRSPEIDVTLCLSEPVLDEIRLRAHKQNQSIESVIRSWITDKVATEALDVLPPDLRKPFFAYGALKPGELGHDLIADDVDRVERASVGGLLFVRDGIPLILGSPNGGQVSGILIWFKSDRGYRAIKRFEPRAFYQWGSVQTETGVEANVLVPADGVEPERGGGDILWEPWQTADDPLFKFGLNTVSATIRADGLSRLEPSDREPETWDRYYRLQSSYMLACSILERIAFRVIGAEADVTARVSKLGREPAFVQAVEGVGFVNKGRAVFRSNDPTKRVKLNQPRHFAEWAYQIRSNLVHRGKSAWQEAELVRTALIDLHDVLRAYLLKKVPAMRLTWEQSWPEGTSTDWRIKPATPNGC